MKHRLGSAESSDVAGRYWGAAAKGERKGDYPVHWLESPLVLRHCINPRISGDPEVGWLEWIQRSWLPSEVERGFVLGCGGGALERRAAALGLCRSFYGVDISPDAVEVARALAEREGWTRFQYEALDANHLELEPESLDLILADMSVHHMDRLEHLFDQFRRSLRSGGLLVLNEFVGPNRFQWTDLQLQLATRAIRGLPFRLRRNRDITIWKQYAKPWVWRAKRWTPERVARMDPSESIRSEEIPRIAAERLQVAEKREYGGTLLALVLNNIVGNFEDTPADVAVLERLADEESRWISSGRLSSDYMVIVGRAL
jgi:SAM-dependent methyltransferase